MFMLIAMGMITMALPRMSPTLKMKHGKKKNFKNHIIKKEASNREKAETKLTLTSTTGPSCLALYRIQNLKYQIPIKFINTPEN